jgi:hypothetical protein
MLMRVENLYGLSFIKYDVIDVNQIHIQKPRKPFVGHYFFFQVQSLQHEMTSLG